MLPVSTSDGTTKQVTVYLVPKSKGRVAKKQRRSREPAVQNAASLPLGKIYADSNRLRECSKYFETCMSERWTTHTQTEFYLEVHTEVRFYYECFARMYLPFHPIFSVADCIQLLKVASQIEYAHVMDIGVQYLAAVPWSDEDEKQIREFYDSGQLSSNSTSDLCKRLQVPSSGEERQQNYLNLTHRVLSRSLKLSSTGLSLESRSENRKAFFEGFQAIVNGSGPGKCGQVLQYALTIVMEELESLLISIKNTKSQEGVLRAPLYTPFGIPLLPKFCWLFYLLRWAKYVQPVVELLLKDPDIPLILQTKFQSLSRDLNAQSHVEKAWARMMRTIFHDVLDGSLFLKTSERLALFQQWNWILKAANFEPDAPLSAKLVPSFLMAFPDEQQEEIYFHWLSSLDDPAQQAKYCDLSDAYSLRVKHLVSQAVKLDAPKCSTTYSEWVIKRRIP